MNQTDALYLIILVVHILAAVVAIGPNFAAPSLSRVEGGREQLANLALFVQLPATFGLLVTGLGMLMSDRWTTVGDSIGKSPFGFVWISIGFVCVIALGVLNFLLSKDYKTGGAKAPMLTGISHLVAVVAIVVMVFGGVGGKLM
jgi:hypothetical protein